ncbi:MAG: polysaccharide deacetylase family protein [Anaerolineae bacterium]
MPTDLNTSGFWPDGRLGAISLTFDDGLDSQLAKAVPLLEQHGFRATFYLNPVGIRWETNLPAWQQVAARGHEIGNHSLSHICSRGFRDSDADLPSLEGMSLEEIEADILAAEERLHAAFPEQPYRSFCYPCYQAYVGEGSKRQSYVPVVAQHFVAGRGRGEVANHPCTSDLTYLWSWPGERLSAWELIGLAESCAAQGRWGIFTFHGLGEGHLPIAPYDFEELLRHLARHHERLWTAPVAEVANRVLAWRRQAS